MRRLLLLLVLLGSVALAQDPSGAVFPDEGVVSGEKFPDVHGTHVFPAEAGTIGITPRPPPPKPGQLLTFWKFEGDSIDEIGPYTGVWQTGSEQYVAGMDGQAAKFDGSNNYVQLNASVGTIGDEADFTWAFWCYMNNVADGAFTITRVLNSGTNYNILFVVQPIGSFIRVRILETNTVYWGTEPVPGDMTQKWTFFALTWDDSAEAGVLYQGYDGAALVETNLTETGAFTNRRLDADQFRIGWQPTNESWVDEFRYWRVELESNDIDTLYAAGPP